MRPDPRSPLPPRPGPSLVARFAAQVERRADQVAVIDSGGAWTYRELDARSNRLAHWLVQRGAAGGVVAIRGHRSSSLVWAVLGVLKAGAGFLLLDPSYPPLWQIGCLEVVVPRAFVGLDAAGALDALVEHLRSMAPVPALLLSEGRRPSADPLAALSETAPLAPAAPGSYVLFTSGSSGRPKAVSATDRPLGHFLEWYSTHFGLDETARFGMLAGLSHDPALRDLFAPIWTGATLCIPDPACLADPRRLLIWLGEQRVTVVHIGPALGRLLAGIPEAPPLPDLRHVFYHGDVVTTGDVAAVSRLAPNAMCVAFYGATETPQAMAYCAAVGHPGGTDAIPIGTPIEGVQLLILDDAMNLVGDGTPGEIYVRTPYLSDGYVGEAVLTRERFIVNPFTQDAGDRMYRTGDLGRYRPDGLVEFCGRADHQVKVGGMRIEPGQLERALLGYPGVHDARVLAQPGKDGRPRLSAYVAMPGRAGASDALRTFLAERFPTKMLPATMTVLDRLPLGPNGKVDHRALLGIEGEG